MAEKKVDEPVVPTKLESMKGAFVDSLKRNNKDIRNDRATSIAEDTGMVYKRAVEDLELSIKKLQRQREASLDLSPGDKMSLVLAKDFDAAEWVTNDIALGVQIRNLEIKLEIARKQYQVLFTE